jgi:hypothetical protein
MLDNSGCKVAAEPSRKPARLKSQHRLFFVTGGCDTRAWLENMDIRANNGGKKAGSRRELWRPHIHIACVSAIHLTQL